MQIETFISLITGTIGTITGVISLAWLILNSKSKLKLSRLYFERLGFSEINGKEYENIDVKITLRNLGSRSTTIEYWWVQIGNRIERPNFFEEETIKPGSSKTFSSIFQINKKEFEEMFNKRRENILGVFINHTFGNIRKEGKTDFEQYYNLV